MINYTPTSTPYASCDYGAVSENILLFLDNYDTSYFIYVNDSDGIISTYKKLNTERVVKPDNNIQHSKVPMLMHGESNYGKQGVI